MDQDKNQDRRYSNRDTDLFHMEMYILGKYWLSFQWSGRNHKWYCKSRLSCSFDPIKWLTQNTGSYNMKLPPRLLLREDYYKLDSKYFEPCKTHFCNLCMYLCYLSMFYSCLNRKVDSRNHFSKDSSKTEYPCMFYNAPKRSQRYWLSINWYKLDWLSQNQFEGL